MTTTKELKKTRVTTIIFEGLSFPTYQNSENITPIFFLNQIKLKLKNFSQNMPKHRSFSCFSITETSITFTIHTLTKTHTSPQIHYLYTLHTYTRSTHINHTIHTNSHKPTQTPIKILRILCSNVILTSILIVYAHSSNF